jgi:molybdopterin-guanine dinucleotide biosynthesis protein A
MGRDKAELPHPEGGCWLERSLRLLAGLGAPLTLLSRWPQHLERAAALVEGLAAGGVPLELRQEPAPQEGPLLALHRLMELHPDQRLLLCPVDMPQLTEGCLEALLRASAGAPERIWIASALRPQPLLGLYPGDPGRRQRLHRAVTAGERALQRWLAGEAVGTVPMPHPLLANVNTPAELEAFTGLGASP